MTQILRGKLLSSTCLLEDLKYSDLVDKIVILKEVFPDTCETHYSKLFEIDNKFVFRNLCNAVFAWGSYKRGNPVDAINAFPHNGNYTFYIFDDLKEFAAWFAKEQGV
jgi:hypothetical protein